MGVHLLLKHAWGRASVRVSLVLLLLALAAATTVAPSGATPSRPRPIAVAARTLHMNLTANLHLVGRPARVLNEQGSISGTLSGSVSSRIVAISSTHSESTFTFYPGGGSMSGQASTHGRVVGANIYFTGTATITKGTGRWAHVSGSGLQYSGVVNRQNLRAIGHMIGSIRY